MPNQKLVAARCSASKAHFGITFIETTAGYWEALETFARPGPTKGYGPTTLPKIGVALNYAGCPHCQNRSIFLCTKCRTLNCQGSAKRQGDRVHVDCAQCGPVGYLITGPVENLSAHSDL